MPTVPLLIAQDSPLIGKIAQEIEEEYNVKVLEVRKTKLAWSTLPRDTPLAEKYEIRASGSIEDLRKVTSAAWNLHERRKLKS